jgi:non-ribosomal peptide synthetase component F
VGHPVSNTRIYILDEHQHPVPVGIAGEIYIAGDGLADGYLQQPEITAVRFLPEPFRAGGRMYRTGHLGKFLPDGTIQWLRSKNPTTGSLDDQLVYWRHQLAGAPSALDLPTDHPRAAVLVPNRGQCETLLPGAVRIGLADLAKKEGVTLFATLLSAFAVLLSRYSDQDEIVVGTPVTGRKHPQNEKLIDLFPNLVALRIVLSANQTFQQLLHHVRDVTLSAYANQDVPFAQAVNGLPLESDRSRTPLQVMFILDSVAPTKSNSGTAARPPSSL